MRPRTSLLIILLAAAACVATAANLGPDDRQVSQTGAPGTVETDAVSPAVAFDETHQRYLLVWSADETDGDFVIRGQMLSGAAGAPVGPVLELGGAPVAGRDQRQPAVAYSPDHGQWLVVWSGDHLNAGAAEIMGRTVSSDGATLGPIRRYSSAGASDADAAFDAVSPDVAWHPFLDAFVLAWAADTDEGVDMLDGRFEVYGQLVAGLDGAETGADDFRISFSLSGPVGNDVLQPAVAVHPDLDRWFCAFEGDVVDDPVHAPDIWMYGVTGDAPDGAATNISVMGGSVFDGFSARRPDLIYLPASNELLCVWDGRDGTPTAAVYGQRLLMNGATTGPLMNFSAGAGTAWGELREATHPAVAFDPGSGNVFVTWRGSFNTGLAHHDHEIFGRLFTTAGAPVDAAAHQLSGMDPALLAVPTADAPVMALNPVHGYALAAWTGDELTTPDGEREIYSQGWSLLGASPAPDTPPAAFALHGNHPNPFNPSTTIAFDLPRAQAVRLRVYDAQGRLVRTLLDGETGPAGRNEVVWHGRDDGGRPAASGLYLYRLEAGGRESVGRMSLVK